MPMALVDFLDAEPHGVDEDAYRAGVAALAEEG